MINFQGQPEERGPRNEQGDVSLMHLKAGRPSKQLIEWGIELVAKQSGGGPARDPPAGRLSKL